MRHPVPALITCAIACSSTHGAIRYAGALGRPTPARVFDNLLLVDVSVDGVGGARVVPDTGAPFVVLSPSSFPGAPLSSGDGDVDSFAFANLVFQKLAVVTANVAVSQDPTVPIDGVVGCTLLCNFSVSFNYRDAEFVLGPSSAPDGVEAILNATPFVLEGGAYGAGQGGSFPPSRIMMHANVEGTDHVLLLDTGSTSVALRSSLFSQIASDGRAVVPLSKTTTLSGTSLSGTALRLRNLAAGGTEVAGVPAVEDSLIDPLLDGLAKEVGHPVDGTLGSAFLRYFFVTIDYPHRTLHVQRYTSGAPQFDEFERVGVRLALSMQGEGYPVDLVFGGTDAAQKGVSVGDVIVAVDGQSMAALGPVEALASLCGVVGSVKMVQFGATQASALSNQTVPMRVDELLPP